ncbi:hypothetical protein BJ138DRAFT_1138681 [Hygrophoropsis aurantiaca]|uniref:Uncharacterized protein n=1 Tax=Hygrophoropsis aurantiaca TaxID=72124 RepID=A0ACB7ZSJ7_9AGAM|nr:hypothetical protein BJ138DRAFT_1138681 [Hygrophoropsis aurantiaca]
MNSYLTFCSEHEFDPEPTIDTLSFFVVYTSAHISPNSVESYLSGLVNELRGYYPNLPNVRSSFIIKRAMQGCRRRFAKPCKRKLPLTKDNLLHVAHSLPHPWSHNDLLFLLLLQIGFFALLRAGELVWPDKRELQDFRKLSMRLSVTMEPNAFQFRIQHAKTDTRFEGNLIRIPSNLMDPDPYLLMQRYLAERDRVFPIHPQLWLLQSGTPPTRSWFMRNLHRFFPDNIGGHSMHAGGATALAAAGVPHQQIQAIRSVSALSRER